MVLLTVARCRHDWIGSSVPLQLYIHVNICMCLYDSRMLFHWFQVVALRKLPINICYHAVFDAIKQRPRFTTTKYEVNEIHSWVCCEQKSRPYFLIRKLWSISIIIREPSYQCHCHRIICENVVIDLLEFESKPMKCFQSPCKFNKNEYIMQTTKHQLRPRFMRANNLPWLKYMKCTWKFTHNFLHARNFQ